MHKYHTRPVHPQDMQLLPKEGRLHPYLASTLASFLFHDSSIPNSGFGMADATQRCRVEVMLHILIFERHRSERGLVWILEGTDIFLFIGLCPYMKR